MAEKYPIQVVTITGKTVTLEVSQSLKVSELKTKLMDHFTIPVHMQQLLKKKQTLENECYLQDYHIRSGTVLHFIVCMDGGYRRRKRKKIYNTPKKIKRRPRRFYMHQYISKRANSDGSRKPIEYPHQKHRTREAKEEMGVEAIKIQNECRTDWRNNDFWEAAEIGDFTGVQRALDYGIQVDCQNWMGHTALFDATESGHFEVVKLLIENNAKVNHIGSLEETPLHRATYHNHITMVDHFLNCGATINARDVNGNTPLHVSAFRGFNDLCALLLERGANCMARNSDQLLPIELVRDGPTLTVVTKWMKDNHPDYFKEYESDEDEEYEEDLASKLVELL